MVAILGLYVKHQSQHLQCHNVKLRKKLSPYSITRTMIEASELLCQLLPKHLQLDSCLIYPVRSHDLAIDTPRFNLLL